MEDLATLILVATFAGLLVAERLWPARAQPAVRRWRARGVVFFVLYGAIATALPLLTDAWLGEHRLLDATSLGTWWGAIVGFLAVDLGLYLWHRLLHRVPLLWRWFHQVHHSAERIDTAGAFYFSPLDIAGFTLVASVSLVLVAGVTVEAAILANLAAGVLAVWQHANISTPRWLGYVVQRPENHAVHHERGVHAYNYGGLSIWDQLSGTWKNPQTFDGVGGFFDGSSDRLGDMLRGRDISRATPPDLAPVADITRRAA